MKRLLLYTSAFLCIAFTPLVHAEVFVIDGSAMSPEIEDGDVVRATRVDTRTLKRGDVVIFYSPGTRNKVMKRIIGLPGERVTLRKGEVYVRMRNLTFAPKLEEPYLSAENKGHTYPHPPSLPDDRSVTYRVPLNQFFVLGDNRLHSIDSRTYSYEQGSLGTIPRSSILRKVTGISSPLFKRETFKTIQYEF